MQRILETLQKSLLLARERVVELLSKGEAGRSVGRGFFGDISLMADLAAEEVIVNTLRERLGNIAIVAEERGIIRERENYDYLAVIDPIDGSNNVAAGIPFYSGAVAIASGEAYSDIVAAAAINYVNGDIYLASAEREGAWKNNQEIRPSFSITSLKQAYVSLDPRIFREAPDSAIRVIKRAGNIRFFGSSVLEILMAAEGRISVFVAYPKIIRTIDFAAPLFICSKAGGVVEWLIDNPSNIKLPTTEKYSFLASCNKAIAEETKLLLYGSSSGEYL